MLADCFSNLQTNIKIKLIRMLNVYNIESYDSNCIVNTMDHYLDIH